MFIVQLRLNFKYYLKPFLSKLYLHNNISVFVFVSTSNEQRHLHLYNATGFSDVYFQSFKSNMVFVCGVMFSITHRLQLDLLKYNLKDLIINFRQKTISL